MAKIKFCSLHRIAYNPALDPNCPQCTLARVSPIPDQVDFDTETQKPVDAVSGQ